MSHTRLTPGGRLALLPLLVCPVAALGDPMRPLTLPAIPTAGASLSGRLAPSAAGATVDGKAAVSAPPAAPARRLLAIREDENGERMALFGERWVRTGDRYSSPDGETVVLSIGTHAIEVEQARTRASHQLLQPLVPAPAPSRPTLRAEAPHSTAAQAPGATPIRPVRPPGRPMVTPLRSEKP